MNISLFSIYIYMLYAANITLKLVVEVICYYIDYQKGKKQ